MQVEAVVEALPEATPGLCHCEGAFLATEESRLLSRRFFASLRMKL
jgi:hypothetical protein